VSSLRTALAVLLAGLALVLTATPAFAHTELKTSSPADGSSLDAAPEKVTLTFEEAVTLPGNPISITGPGGAEWTVGTPTISGASVSAAVQPTGPAGQYFLHYTVTADDGDAVKGTVTFNLTRAATPATAEAAPATVEAAAPVATAPAASATGAVAAPTTADTSSDSGSSAWVWVAVIVVVLGLAAAGFVVARRRRGVDSGTR
jgi:copper resistance protein C